MSRIIKLYFVFLLLLTIFFISCNQLYKAGNLIDLHYPIETSLKSEIIERYLDTLIQKHGYNVPKKWVNHDKLVDIDSTNNKRIYFKEYPEEMYLVSFGGMLVLSDIYNPQIKQNDWVSERDLMPKEEEIRIKERFKEEVLDVIEAMSKRDGLPDSVIYKK